MIAALEPNYPQHDETIVPVRPGLRTPASPGGEIVAAAPLRRLAFVLLGFGALAVAGLAAFYWLPARVEQQRAAARPAPVPVPVVEEPARPVLSPEESAALRAESNTLLAGLLTLQETLQRLNVPDWAAEEWEQYRTLSDDGDNAYLAGDFATSAARYGDAKALGDGLVTRASTTLAESLAGGQAALEAGNAERALEQFAAVLTIDPEHSAALAGQRRAERLPDVLALVQRAGVEASRGELEAALASYREALAIDAAWPAANAGVAEMSRRLRDAAFERQLSAAFGLLGAEDYVGAQREFKAALAMRPGSREAAEGLAQADEGAKLDAIALAEARALAFERRELWAQAIELYRSVLADDLTLLFAQTGLERAQERAGLDAKLVNLIDNPTLLFGDSVLADARDLLASAAEVEDKGPRLTAQIAELSNLVALASQPISVRLESDQLTNVTLYRVGTLGAFAAKDVELRPGTYTVIGSRDGYRDVRQTFTVRPGRNLEPISVVCIEPI